MKKYEKLIAQVEKIHKKLADDVEVNADEKAKADALPNTQAKLLEWRKTLSDLLEGGGSGGGGGGGGGSAHAPPSPLALPRGGGAHNPEDD